jgi:hypothetical protein
MDTPAITALVPWFGSKRTLAPEVLIINGPSYAPSEEAGLLP